MSESPTTKEKAEGATQIEFAEKRDIEQSSDDEEQDKMTFVKLMALIAMAFLWTGSQIPLYLYGSCPPYIYQELGGEDRWTWFVLGNLFALGAICPFVGSLSDLFGRRYVAIGGASLLVLGNIVAATAHTMNTFIAGMSISGVGAGINELTALAVTSELAPTRKRGIYVAILTFTIVPYCPSVLWGQLVASHGSWRYIGLWCGVWAFIGLAMTVIFYHPPPRINSAGLSKREILRRIDYVGGVLSISGVLLFMAGVQWGGYQYSWTSAHVLAPLILGGCLFIAFIFYEMFLAPYPMFPGALLQEPRVLLLTFIITFISGSSFFSVLMFWPTQSYNVYGHNPLAIGVRNLALGFPILAGACIVLALLSVTRGRVRELMIVSCCFMCAGGAAMSALNRDNVWLSPILLIISGLGIGGIILPASIMSTIICPDELIATVTALTLTIRVLGGGIGYAVYYNVFLHHFVKNATIYLGAACILNGITSTEEITEVIELTGIGLLDEILLLPSVNGNKTLWNILVAEGQLAYAKSYPYVYYVSLAFGIVALVCACFLKDITKHMTNHIAVHMEDKVPEPTPDPRDPTHNIAHDITT